jgi:hypothetical protein
MSNVHISSQVYKVYSEIPRNWEPDIVIGSSQGGAVAMAAAPFFPAAKFILVAPAWKIFNVKPDLPPGSVIIQGQRDVRVPVDDAKELAQATGARLVITNDGHYVSPSAVVQAVKELEPLCAKKEPPDNKKGPNFANAANSTLPQWAVEPARSVPP